MSNSFLKQKFSHLRFTNMTNILEVFYDVFEEFSFNFIWSLDKILKIRILGFFLQKLKIV